MSVKVFIPQSVIDTWVGSEEGDLQGTTLVLRRANLPLNLEPAFLFYRTAGGEDDRRLIGRIKTKTALEKLGAELYMTSVLLGETAYEVELGFLAHTPGGADPRPALLALAPRG